MNQPEKPKASLARLEAWQRRLLPLGALIILCGLVSLVMLLTGSGNDGVQTFLWLVASGGFIWFLFVEKRRES